jgi:hypothetical protein
MARPFQDPQKITHWLNQQRKRKGCALHLFITGVTDELVTAWTETEWPEIGSGGQAEFASTILESAQEEADSRGLVTRFVLRMILESTAELRGSKSFVLEPAQESVAQESASAEGTLAQLMRHREAEGRQMYLERQALHMNFQRLLSAEREQMNRERELLMQLVESVVALAKGAGDSNAESDPIAQAKAVAIDKAADALCQHLAPAAGAALTKLFPGPVKTTGTKLATNGKKEAASD